MKAGQANEHAGRPTLAELVKVYGKIGILGFGGGYAVLAFIRTETVERQRWITAAQFDHIVEMMSFAPGATTINVMAAIAYRLNGWAGLVAGTVAVLWPSFVLILLMARLTAVLHSPWLAGALKGVEVAVVALLIDVVITLGKEVPRALLTVCLGVLAAVLVLVGVNPALTLLLVATLGLIDYLIRRRPLPDVPRATTPTTEESLPPRS
jgi:chromate transporter